MKRTNLAGAGLALGRSQSYATTAQGKDWQENAKIENIIVLFVDQQRMDCLGCYGNPVVQTPNIDRLAQNGIRFNNAFAPTAVCTPARTSLQTGRWAHKTGVMHNTAWGSLTGGVKDPPPSTQFFSDSLSEINWKLAHIGKWHVGTEKNKPTAHGYDDLPYYPDYGYPANHPHYLAHLKKHGVSSFKLLSEKRDPSGEILYSGIPEGQRSASIPVYLADQTVDIIKRYSGSERPFFVSCNFWGPHEPYRIPKEYYDMYKSENIEPWPNFDCSLADKPDMIKRYGEYWHTGWFDKKVLSGLIAEYYGYITLIDEEIGRILKTLEEAGELDSTLIIYSADHGSTVGSYRMWAKGFGMYDCVTRIPLIISHSSIQPGVSDTFVSLLDFAPTFWEIAGCDVPEGVDGNSLLPLLYGSENRFSDEFIITEAFGHQVPFWQRMVRTQHSKFVFSPAGKDEFYDLDSDPWETKNVIGKIDRKTLNRHKEIFFQWMEDNNDPIFRWCTRMIGGDVYKGKKDSFIY
ncbi:MAG: sulfatase-like hydrolase/transferase [Candidatus Latescibacteria bacterium]|nr:sulfatase-like hydrolase/transferase [Candidatus Latescibacterota bacterium]